MNQIKDWRGTVVEVGDVILYAVKHSTSVEVNEAIVKEVGMKPRYAWSDDHLVPTVSAEWHTSSYCYMPGRQLIISNERKQKNVVLTNFEGLTVVAKHRAPAFATDPKPVRWVGGVADLRV